eukprot:TRINITY_DN2631_c0_g1_i1.p1 TRINITY_DN2631_c0_g1~~TRINITY_DN2631_c0_g1_i1.p1  ORF type:complete len:255 (+),score=64.67 TRINITY_DN2631_c0_g1_i1:114-878(+)
MAKAYENNERYHDMAKCMIHIVKSLKEDEDLDNEERNHLSVAYKNLIGDCRTTHRYFKISIEREEERDFADDSTSNHINVLQMAKNAIGNELIDIAKELLDLLDHYLTTRAKEDESKVFYEKLKGDYNRYIAETMPHNSDERVDYAQKALNAYKDATSIAEAKLAPTNSTRLGLALNFSVFYFEILELRANAYEHARNAFNQAITAYEDVEDQSLKDACLILELLKSNLTLWAQDVNIGSNEVDATYPEDEEDK